MPDPFKPLTVSTLAVLVMLTALTVVVAQLAFPDWGRETFSPLHLALAMAAVLALLMSFVMGFLKRSNSSRPAFWIFSTLMAGFLIVFEIADIGLERLPQVLNLAGTASEEVGSLVFGGIALLTIIFAGLEFSQNRRLASASLLCIAVYVGLNAFEDAQIQYVSGWAPQILMLIALELFLVFGYRASLLERRTSSQNTGVRADEGFGDYARRLFESGPIRRTARHPPIRAAFFPVLKETTVTAAMVYLLFRAGPALRKAEGISIFRQYKDMLLLWFREGIDPPSYYSFELYRPERLAQVPQLLTRFETKNGLFATLNRFLPNPNKSDEMNNKAQFSAVCKASGVAHPVLLATVSKGAVSLLEPATELEQDLFCKPIRGMGAMGTIGFHYRGNGQYTHQDGKITDIEGIWAALKPLSENRALIVQPWLRNHEEIVDLAKDSLLVFRLVTCLGIDGEPQVALAMLRLLSKLEPQWTFLPDEEYAAPIDIETGRLGLWTGDNFATSHVHMTHHPVTGAAIEGRMIQNWPALMKIACDVHAACRHRIVVGWDIALTADGPVVLEGNSNFDVMFLQRVLGLGIGDTPLGPLLKYHLHHIVHARTLQ